VGIYRDPIRKEWVYKFEYRKKAYGARGFVTRREAITAREMRRKEVKSVQQPIKAGMGFREAANAYLDYSKRKHAKRTYDYKFLTYKSFLQTHNDSLLTDIEPTHITAYLNTFKTNAVYNARRKDLSALFEWVIWNYKLSMSNPCQQLEKMPHEPPQEITQSFLCLFRQKDTYQ